MEPKIHTLANGATIITTSPGHGARFSDGTVAEAQHKEVCDKLTCVRTMTQVGEVKGMKLTSLRMVLEPESLDYLAQLCKKADLVLVPFPVLTALREQGQRTWQEFNNVVAAIATKETERVPPDQKMWDVNNWSW